MILVPVALEERSYDVRIGALGPEAIADVFASAIGNATGVAVLVDGRLAQVSPLVSPLVAALAARLPSVKRLDIAAGESSKTLAAIGETCQWLADSGFDRGASIVGIGGGATSDHAGFAAAVYLRGIPFAICSTTLLGMVDASVGGKIGVDLPAGKNLVGAFHQPRAVVAELGFLDTLPAREQAAGMAEIVKAALIADAGLLTTLESQSGPWTPAKLAPVIAAAVRIKAKVVADDEREGGRRAILNFGHTIGHAIEAASGYDLLHGEAVALGMVAALCLGAARGTTPAALVPRVCTLLTKLGLPVDVKKYLTPAVLERIEVDKKRRSDKVRFVFVSRVGESILEDIPVSEVKAQALSAL